MNNGASLPPSFSLSTFSGVLYWPNSTWSHLVRESTKVTRSKLWRRVGSGSGSLVNISIMLSKRYFPSSFLLPSSMDKRVSFPWKNKHPIEVLLASERLCLRSVLIDSDPSQTWVWIWKWTHISLCLKDSRKSTASLVGDSPWQWVKQRTCYVGQK